MAESEPPTGPGDSTPNFDWLRDHEGAGGEPWRAPGAQDSALDMLPPEEQPGAAAVEPDSQQSMPSAAEPEPTGVWSPPVEPGAAEVAPAPVVDGVQAAAPSSGLSAGGATAIEVPRPASTVMTGSRPKDSTAQTDRQKLVMIGLISYASAATLALIYLLLTLSNPQPHQLESLPDVEPLKENEPMRLVLVDAEMPPGHTLRLGESQQYGHVRVEPLRVTREPVAFAHFSGQPGVSKPETAPVLKLWVRFTNASTDQTIAPLDAGLLYVRTLRDSGEVRANQFVCRASEKSGDGTQVLVYDHPPTSEWDLIGQQLGKPLGPGESVEMYIPTEEAGLDQLTGALVWRVHFRKGYSPSGNGVTTVVEIAFDSSQIQGAAG